MAATPRAPPVNLLLAALPSADRRRMLAGCETVELAIGDELASPSDRIRHVYFPTDSFISLITPIDDSAALEVGLIGNEGMVGIPLVLGVEVSERRALVQGGGPALRMSAAQFCRELRRSTALQRRLARYAWAMTPSETLKPARRWSGGMMVPWPTGASPGNQRTHSS